MTRAGERWIGRDRRGGTRSVARLARFVCLEAPSIRLALFAWAVAAGTSNVVLAENWPGWRGPGRNGVSREASLPQRWSEDEGIAWKRAVVGRGVSGVVVWGDRLYLTGSSGPRFRDLHVVALSARDGSELWHRRFWGTSPTRCHGQKSTMATPTPVTDGEAVFAFFGTGDVFAVDRDGGPLWQRSLAREYGVFENRFAASSSPLLYQDLVIVQCDHYGDSYLIALDKTTGVNRWRVERPETWHSWASPQLISVDRDGGQRDELIVCSSKKVDAFAPASGEFLWTVAGMQRECIPTPVFAHGILYAVSGPGGSTLAIRPGGSGDVTDSRVEWTSSRGVPFVPSAIVVGDRYYLIDDKGIATCLDAHSGDRVWQHRLPGQYTAPPVAAGGRVYFMNETGVTVVVDATKQDYAEVGRSELAEPIYAPAAIAHGRLYIRTSGHVYCVGGTGGSEQH